MALEFNGISDPAIPGLLQGGAVGVLPTDTLYGIVCRAADQQAVKRLYGLKRRENKPGTVIAASVEQLVELGLKARYLKAVAQFWPGAVSVIIPAGQELDYLHQGKQSLAVRIPDLAELTGLLEKTGPLLTTSVNKPGEPHAIDINGAKAYFADYVDFYVDGGDLSGHEPSTVIRVVDDAIEIIRPGAVNIGESGRIS